ncbi:MAG: hypothetical protein AAF360_09395, partial [Pseudomonadota bacterium]
VLARVTRSNFGICTGVSEGRRPALTDWIASGVERVAGRSGDGAPLTIRDLKTFGIDIATMTTDLSAGRAYRLPFGDAHHWFEEAAFRRIFPNEIVDHLIARSDPAARREEAPPAGFHLLPPPDDMPVVVLARLSLSFPLLFETVPLWRKDYGVGARGGPPKDGAWREKARLCLFSDGGLSSNFPMHFFDAFLPRRPTFGIVLQDWSHDHHGGVPREDAPAARVSLYDIESADHAGFGGPHHNTLPVRSIGGVAGFLYVLINTAKDWRDTLHTALPGAAERIVEIRLKRGSEGGLNLRMDPDTQRRLVSYGEEAGARLVEAFADGVRFDEHRYLRALSLMAEVEKRLDWMKNAYRTPPDGDPGAMTYEEVLKRYEAKAFTNRPDWRERGLAAFAAALIDARVDVEAKASAGTVKATPAHGLEVERVRIDGAHLPDNRGDLRVTGDARSGGGRLWASTALATASATSASREGPSGGVV